MRPQDTAHTPTNTPMCVTQGRIGDLVGGGEQIRDPFHGPVSSATFKL